MFACVEMCVCVCGHMNSLSPGMSVCVCNKKEFVLAVQLYAVVCPYSSVCECVRAAVCLVMCVCECLPACVKPCSLIDMILQENEQTVTQSPCTVIACEVQKKANNEIH